VGLLPRRMGSHFQLDGSPTLACRANEVWVSEPARESTKFNALWKEGPGLSARCPAAQCVEAHVLEGGDVWFGLADERRFGKGWACHGFSYGGNLSDGGALLRSQFGPRLEAGSVVALRSEVLDGALHVHVRVNGEGLGKAFQVALPPDVGPLFPLVSFSTGPARVRLVRASCPPLESFLRGGGASAARASPGGDWALPAAALLPPAAAAPLRDVVFSVDARRWALSARVANTMSVQLGAAAPHAGSGQVLTTKMMPPPELQQLESSVLHLLQQVQGISLADGGHALELQSTAGTKRLRAVDKVFTPVSADEINWMRR
jgi:hypothetical protein